MTHSIVVHLDDPADVELLAAALEARVSTLTRAATGLAGDLAPRVREKADIRTQALRVTEVLMEAASLTAIAAAVRAAPVYLDRIAQLDETPDNVLADILAGAGSADGLELGTADPDDPDPDSADAEVAALVDATTPDVDPEPEPVPAPALAARRTARKEPAVPRPSRRPAPPPEPQEEEPSDPGAATIQSLARARAAGALASLPPLRDDDPADGGGRAATVTL